jgi:hypothetical protein
MPNNKLYDPFNWFWLADDGRLFTSKRQTTVDQTDVDYIAWVETGGVPTPWPTDMAGVQTSEALQEVLLPYGLFVDLKAYSAGARFNEETGGMVVNGFPVNTDRVSQSALASAYNHSKEDPAASFSYRLTDGTFVTLTAAQIPLLATAVAAHTQACFAAEANLVTNIDAGTVTTHQQVDDIYAAIPDTAALKDFPKR